jgi:FMN reductase
LSALRQTVHALRGWPTPYGIAMNVADGLCAFDGRFTDTRADESARIVAGQIMQFVTAFRDMPASSAPELRACPVP